MLTRTSGSAAGSSGGGSTAATTSGSVSYHVTRVLAHISGWAGAGASGVSGTRLRGPYRTSAMGPPSSTINAQALPCHTDGRASNNGDMAKFTFIRRDEVAPETTYQGPREATGIRWSKALSQ